MPVDEDSRKFALTLGGWGLGIFAISMGWTLRVQGDQRLTAPAWEVALKLPVGTNFWGWALVACGLAIVTAMAIGKRARIILVIAALAIGFIFWARSVAGVITADEPHASWLGPQMWGAFALIYMAHAAAHINWTNLVDHAHQIKAKRITRTNR